MVAMGCHFVHPPDTRVSVKQQWNGIDSKNQRTLRKISPISPLAITNFTWTDLRKPGPPLREGGN
jgi:hypothetical protein